MFQNAKLVDPSKVAIYIRWSTEDQGLGHTQEVQKDSCIQTVMQRGWIASDSRIYTDAGHSGTTLDRPALMELRNDVKAGLIDCVVTYNLSRLSRHVADAVNLILDEWEGVCHWVSASEGVSTLDATARLLLPMLASLAQMDRDRIVSNTRAGKYAAARKGNYNGGEVAYGFMVCTETKRIVKNPDEVKFVRRMVEEFLAGKGVKTIARDFNREKVPTRKGGRWNEKTIASILDHPMLQGTLVYGRTMVNPRRRRNKHEKQMIPGTDVVTVNMAVEPIVTPAEWRALRELRAYRADKTKGVRRLESDFLLSGLTRCSCCGFTVSGSSSGRNGNQWYVCMGRKSDVQICKHRNHRKEELEAAVLSTIRENLKVDYRLNLLEQMVSRHHAKMDQLKTIIVEAGKRINEAKTGIDRWARDYEKGRVDIEFMNLRTRVLQAEKAEAEVSHQNALRALKQLEARSPQDSITELETAAKELEGWDDLTVPRQKQILRTLIQSIKVFHSPEGERVLEVNFVSTADAEPLP